MMEWNGSDGASLSFSGSRNSSVAVPGMIEIISYQIKSNQINMV